MKTPTITITVAKSKNGENYYTAKHRNGNILFRASETYRRRIDCVRGLERVLRAIKDGDYQII